MNTKAEAFSSFLNEKAITDYQLKELPDDDQNTVVFGTNIVVEGDQLPTWVILGDSLFITIRVLILNNAITMDNEMQLMYFVNGLNRGFRPFKMYFDGDGALVMEVCWTTNGSTQKNYSTLGNEIYRELDIIITYLKQNYKNWMKDIL